MSRLKDKDLQIPKSKMRFLSSVKHIGKGSVYRCCCNTDAVVGESF